MGSGTSHGVPVIACGCATCASKDRADNRLRSSALVRTDDGLTILIDAGPEFRIQALRSKVLKIDALLVTHPHADHVHGIDDLRIFSREKPLPVYGTRECVDELRERFAYVFRETQEGGGKPKLELIAVDEPFRIGENLITPIPVLHGLLPIYGWRIADTAYITDVSFIPEESFKALKGIRNAVIGALRKRPHSTHYNFEQALEAIGRLDCENAWFTHLCHDFTHVEIKEWLREHGIPGKKIEPAHDGLRISINSPD